MRSSFLLVAAGSISGALAAPAPVVSNAPVHVTALTYTEELCFTFYGTKSVKLVPTAIQAVTVTLSPQVTTTVTPIKTVTPAKATVTATRVILVTSTLPSVTDRATSTVINTYTSTATSIESDTVTTTVSTTITAPTTTTTVSIPSGFVYPPSAPAASKRSHIDAPQEEATATSQLDSRNLQPAQPRGGQPNKLWPARVACDLAVEVIKPVTVTHQAPTHTVTVKAVKMTTTVLATSTVVAAAPQVTIGVSMTMTITAVTTATSTVLLTSTATATSTVVPPSATYYAACGAQNQVSKYYGYPISVYSVKGDSAPVVDVADAYSCCAACMSLTGCATYDFLLSAVSAGQGCRLQVFNSCSSGQSNTGLWLTTGGNTVTTYVGNGLCGTVLIGG